jgi:hypothetical protein
MTGCVHVRRRGCRPARVKWVSAGDTGYTGFISSHPGIIFFKGCACRQEESRI